MGWDTRVELCDLLKEQKLCCLGTNDHTEIPIYTDWWGQRQCGKICNQCKWSYLVATLANFTKKKWHKLKTQLPGCIIASGNVFEVQYSSIQFQQILHSEMKGFRLLLFGRSEEMPLTQQSPPHSTRCKIESKNIYLKRSHDRDLQDLKLL